MTTRAKDDRVTEVVRTRRLELVDDEGRVRVTIDAGGVDESSEGAGLTLYDEHGSARAWLTTDEYGVELGLCQDGNLVLSVGVADQENAVCPGPRVSFGAGSSRRYGVNRHYVHAFINEHDAWELVSMEPRRSCTCDYADHKLHDELLRIEGELASVLRAFGLIEFDEALTAEDFRHFVGQHNWKNPAQVQELAERVEWAEGLFNRGAGWVL